MKIELNKLVFIFKGGKIGIEEVPPQPIKPYKINFNTGKISAKLDRPNDTRCYKSHRSTFNFNKVLVCDENDMGALLYGNDGIGKE